MPNAKKLKTCCQNDNMSCCQNDNSENDFKR